MGLIREKKICFLSLVVPRFSRNMESWVWMQDVRKQKAEGKDGSNKEKGEGKVDPSQSPQHTGIKTTFRNPSLCPTEISK